MTLKQRRFLYIFFIILFLVISPLISLYAAGYKINFRAGQIQKTGALIIKTKPKGAQIFLNGKKQQKNWQKFWLKKNIIVTPAKITHLLPGKYQLQLKKTGYWPWRQQITVQPGQSINLSDILLFKKDAPWPLFYLPQSKLYPAPNKKKVIAINKKGVFLLDLLNNNFEKILTASSVKWVVWSDNSQQVVIDKTLIKLTKNKEKARLNFYLANKQIKNNLASTTALAKIRNIRFISNYPNTIYYLLGNVFYSLDLSSGQKQKIFASIFLQDAILKDNYLAVVRSINGQSTLDFYSIDGRNLLRTISLPPSQNFVFLKADNKLLNLYDKTHHVLYLINPHSLFPIVETIKNIKKIVWHKDKLLYSNDFEVWLYDLQERKKTIVTRLSQPINDIFWHPQGKHIFFSTAKSIFIAELRRNYYQNINNLVSFPLINSSFFMPSLGLIFSGQIGSQVGIYRLEL